MKASEYIAKLRALIEAHGDLPCVSDCDFGLQVADEPYAGDVHVTDICCGDGRLGGSKRVIVIG